MSLAFVTGKLSARNMMNYARRIEFDFATVDLNNTVVGFSHGDDTFGWRFYPRFQTPEIESNTTVFFRDLVWGGPSRDELLHKRRLEPGIRECCAIVIMPSFVPYATLHVSSDWFKLTNPKRKVMDSTDAMKLSRQVIRVTIPANPVLVGDANQKFVDVNLATPYGVTPHLLIPAVVPPQNGAAQDGPAWKTETWELAFVYKALGIAAPDASAVLRARPTNLVIQKGNIDTGCYDTVDVALQFEKQYNIDSPIIVTAVVLKFKSSQNLAPEKELAMGKNLTIKWPQAPD